MKYKIVTLVLLLLLSSCIFNSPTRVADNYFSALYNSENYTVKKDSGNIIDVIKRRVAEMEENTKEYTTEEHKERISDGIKFLVTSVIFTFIDTDHDFSLKKTEYSLNELDSDDDNKYYDYLLTIEIVSSSGDKRVESFMGIIHMKKVDNNWLVNSDNLTIYKMITE